MLVFDQLKKNDPPLRLLALVVLAGLLVLLAGLWWVQIVRAGDYRQHLETQSLRSVRVPAVRGRILDRNGNALAENRARYNVNLYLEDLTPAFQKEYERLRPGPAAPPSLSFWKRWLGRPTAGVPYVRLKDSEVEALKWQARYRVANGIVQQITTQLQQPHSLDLTNFQHHYGKKLVLPYPVLTGLSPAQVARFEEQCATLPGVDLEIQSMRTYPLGSTAAHVLGHLKFDDSSMAGEDASFSYRLPDYIGVVGVEAGFDQQLHGHAGAKSVLVNNLGYRQTETMWDAVEPGNNIVLTLDLPIQQAAERALKRIGPQLRGGSVRGAAVVMDVRNGDILALVSEPAYDPNQFISRINAQDYARLNDPFLRPQINRATQGTYYPGSIFKTVVALAALDSGWNPNEKYYVRPNPADPAHGIYVCRGGHTIRDLAPPGDYDFHRALLRSSNAYFINCGVRTGIERIVELGRRLHLSENTGLPTRQDVRSSFPDPQQLRSGWGEADTANVSIGQDPVKVTPLQMAVLASAIANGGRVFWPRLVERIEPPSPAPHEPPLVLEQGRIRDYLHLQPRSFEILGQAMLADTEDPEGTAYSAFHDSSRGTLSKLMRVCGKTGTAQIQNERGQTIDHTTWFLSFAPYEQPRYAVVVMVESGGSGGTTCAPVGHEIYLAIQQRESAGNEKPLAKAN